MNTQSEATCLNVFMVEEYGAGRGKKARNWAKIGVAFPHKEGPAAMNAPIASAEMNRRRPISTPGSDAVRINS